MKFVRYSLIAIAFISLVVENFGKNMKRQSDSSTSSRNYRKYNADISFNPLPRTWTTGPRENYAPTTAEKYHHYMKKLHEGHEYRDNTKILENLVRKKLMKKFMS